MTKEEKALIMQLMGQTYGELKQNDERIVGRSGNLQPGSEIMKQQVEQFMTTPTQQSQPMAPPPAEPPREPEQQAPPTQSHEISYKQAAQELIQLEQASQADPAPDEKNQLEFDLKEPEKIDKLIETVEMNRLLLKEIKLLLEKNGRKKAQNRKPG